MACNSKMAKSFGAKIHKDGFYTNLSNCEETLDNFWIVCMPYENV